MSVKRHRSTYTGNDNYYYYFLVLGANKSVFELIHLKCFSILQLKDNYSIICVS